MVAKNWGIIMKRMMCLIVAVLLISACEDMKMDRKVEKPTTIVV
jgi:hypothetical protein